jgi:hypothetical protein
VPSGLGADLEEPFIFTAPGEDSGDGVDETEEEQAEDEESTSDESLSTSDESLFERSKVLPHETEPNKCN